MLPPGITAEPYRELLAGALDAVRAFDARALVVSLGFDTATGDPAGGRGPGRRLRLARRRGTVTARQW